MSPSKHTAHKWVCLSFIKGSQLSSLTISGKYYNHHHPSQYPSNSNVQVTDQTIWYTTLQRTRDFTDHDTMHPALISSLTDSKQAVSIYLQVYTIHQQEHKLHRQSPVRHNQTEVSNMEQNWTIQTKQITVPETNFFFFFPACLLFKSW